jgi:CRP/FNR family cyclic AMP-dependent transcriptional regulator
VLPLDWISNLPEASFSAGDKIIEEGSRPGRILFLKSGRVEVVRDGIRVALIKTPGSVLGEISVFLDIAATANVVALEETVFHVAEDALAFLKEHPDVHVHVSKNLAYRLDAATRYLVDVKEQLAGYSDHLGMVDGVLDAIVYRDLKKKVSTEPA